MTDSEGEDDGDTGERERQPGVGTESLSKSVADYLLGYNLYAKAVEGARTPAEHGALLAVTSVSDSGPYADGPISPFKEADVLGIIHPTRLTIVVAVPYATVQENLGRAR